MTGRPGTQSSASASRSSRRRLVLIGAAGLIVLVVGVLLVVSFAGGDGDGVDVAAPGEETNTQATETTSPPLPTPPSTVTPPTSPSATLPVDGPEVGVSTLAPVGVEQQETFQSGIAVQVVEVDDVDAEAVVPGETAGPAIAVQIEARNTGRTDVDLIGFVVSASDENDTPLLMNSSDPADPLGGVLAPGEARTGWYVFRVDGDPTVVLRIEDGLSPDAIIVEL
jgi:hypothetical protein